MGQVKENLLTKGFSGRIGDEIVFRQVNGRTTFSKRPRKRETFGPIQQQQQSKFQQASYYARTTLINPVQREEYARAAKLAGFKSAYVAALTDYMVEPKIANINVTAYKGTVGEAITFVAAHDFKVVEAVVTIKRADDTVIETGVAVLGEYGWLYLAQQANASVTGCKVMVTIKDRLNKTATEEVVMV